MRTTKKKSWEMKTMMNKNREKISSKFKERCRKSNHSASKKTARRWAFVFNAIF